MLPSSGMVRDIPDDGKRAIPPGIGQGNAGMHARAHVMRRVFPMVAWQRAGGWRHFHAMLVRRRDERGGMDHIMRARARHGGKNGRGRCFRHAGVNGHGGLLQWDGRRCIREHTQECMIFTFSA